MDTKDGRYQDESRTTFCIFIMTVLLNSGYPLDNAAGGLVLEDAFDAAVGEALGLYHGGSGPC